MEWIKLKVGKCLSPTLRGIKNLSLRFSCPSDYQKPLTFYDSLFLKFYMTNKCLKQIEQYLIKEI